MLKKLCFVLLGLGALTVAAATTSVGSYLTTSYRKVAGSVEDSVPIQFQIDRARNMVHDMEPEIRHSMHVIAKEEVEVAELGKRIDAAETKAAKEKSEIMTLQTNLKTGNSVFRFAGHSYTSDEVKQDLSRRFSRFKTSDATNDSLKQMRDARERNLEAARQKLTAMIAAQRQLQVEVENLEAKLKLVQVAEASSEFQFDDSQLARCKDLMTDIRTRLDVAAKLANAETNFHDQIPLDEASPEDISDQVTKYFNQDKPAEATVATASVTE